MSTKTEAPQTHRQHYIDNIRWILALLVVVAHAAITYGPAGSWTYKDRTTIDPIFDLVFAVTAIPLKSFLMGLFFVIAGYFIPQSLQRRGDAGYLTDRLRRLGLPSLVYMLIVAPAIIYPLYYLDWPPLTFYTTYASNIPGWDSGPLWFLPALLFFTILYVALRKLVRWPSYEGPLTIRRLSTFVAVAILGTIWARLYYPIGSSVWNMQLGNFPQYVVLFLFGIIAFRNDWLTKLSIGDAKRYAALAILSTLVLLVPNLLLGGAFTGNLLAYAGGVTVQAVLYVVWEQVFGASMILCILFYFREHFNHQGSATRKLSENAFGMYFFHAPVLILFGVLLHGVQLPVGLKFLALVVSGLVGTYLFSEYVLRRTPGLREIM